MGASNTSYFVLETKTKFSARRNSWVTPMNGLNSFHSATKLRHNDELIVKIMMPLYYNEEPIRLQELYDAKRSWDIIMNNSSPEFISKKPSLPYSTCREWFEQAFYQRLFNVHPFCKKMFKDPSTQGKFLVALFSFVFTLMDDEEKFNVRLLQLAESHAQRGVKSSEYAIIGEVMFWTLRTCLGPIYDSKAHNGWVKIFSNMLKVIVPASVSFELKNNHLQKERVEKFMKNKSTPTSVNSNYVSAKYSACPFVSENAGMTEKKKTSIKVLDFIRFGKQRRRSAYMVTPNETPFISPVSKVK